MFFSFLGLSLVALGIGIFAERNEVYFCGVILLLFTGLLVLQGGINNSSGQLTNTSQTMIGNDTNYVTSTTFVYETTSDYWTNGIGLLLIVIAAGLSLHFYTAKKDREKSELESIDVKDP